MSKHSNHGLKVLAFIAVALIGAAAGFGYFKQATDLAEQQASPEASVNVAVLKPRADDISVGKQNAPVTVVEYFSLSCSHCADFSRKVFPTIEKNYIDTGKVRFIYRHFPLNEPAMKAAQLVECAGQNGLDRLKFVKTLLDMQSKWAFTEDYMKNLKQIVLVGGIDSAAFESCNTDKNLETKVLSSRKEGDEVLKVESTPTFYINGKHYTGGYNAGEVSAALDAAAKPQE